MTEQVEGLDAAHVGALWSVADVARYLGVPVNTVYQWRVKGYGPAGVRVGRFVRFRPVDVAAWVAAQLVA